MNHEIEVNKRHRRSIRLDGYDYASSGAYFITICVQHRECLLGDILNQKMVLNDGGIMVETWMNKITSKYPNINIDTFCIMPNHVHFIVFIDNLKNVGADPCVCPENMVAPAHQNVSPSVGADPCV
jgi:hypothetical protein